MLSQGEWVLQSQVHQAVPPSGEGGRGSLGASCSPVYAGQEVRNAAQALASDLQGVLSVHEATGLLLDLGAYERARVGLARVGRSHRGDERASPHTR